MNNEYPRRLRDVFRLLSQPPRMLIALAAIARIVTSEITPSVIISSLARRLRGIASVGLNEVAVVNAINR